MELIERIIDYGWIFTKLGLVVLGMVFIFFILIVFIKSFVESLLKPKKTLFKIQGLRGKGKSILGIVDKKEKI